MDVTSIKLTIYFENPFWVGIFERNINGKLSACRVVFGQEPKDNQVLEFVLKNDRQLQYSPEILNENVVKEKVNPKRMQRDSKRQIQNLGIGTKSQQALKLQQEKNKTVRKAKRKEQKEFKRDKMYILRQQKKREKHKGR
ncbi:MAG: YjdF family protein [Clostridia bacterium]